MDNRPRGPLTDRQLKWDRRFLALAATVATWSKDPSTRVGAVIVRPDNTVAAMGFNGFPRGMPDDPLALIDRSIKYPRTIHAEMNAILTAKEPLKGYTLYCSPLPPCDRCAVHVIQAGIGRVVAPKIDNDGRWAGVCQSAAQYFAECGVIFETATP